MPNTIRVCTPAGYNGSADPLLHSPTLQQLRDLAELKSANPSGLFLLEGVRPLYMAIQQSVVIERLVVAPELFQGGTAARLVKQLRIARTPCTRLTSQAFCSISQLETPHGVAAIVRQRWHKLDSVDPSGDVCWIGVEGIRSGGNLGTIIRTADAVGAAGILLFGDAVDPYNGATARATMGSLFSIRFVRTSISEFAAWKRRSKVEVVGTAIDGEYVYTEHRFAPGTIVLMGCERKGLSQPLRATCDTLVRIPMVGATDSLNVGIAAGVVMYEVFRQRASRC